MKIDYALYLVTGRDLLPPGKIYLQSLEEVTTFGHFQFDVSNLLSLIQALQGGVTVVQIREKNADTAEFLDIAVQSKEVCDRYNIPLIINDRVDVARLVGAHGVHLGQTDMSVAEARRILPIDSIVGVSCNNAEHVRTAVKDGADYVGIGPAWTTQTKFSKNPPVGVRGIGKCLEVLDGTTVKAIVIGGIKSTNLLRTLHGSISPTFHALDGVAVVSEIFASFEPRVAAQKLLKIFRAFRPDLPLTSRVTTPTVHDIVEGVISLMDIVRKVNPLVHQITNVVAATQSANITLALGGSPIMASEFQEMEDLNKICGSLLINIGTLRSDLKESIYMAGHSANLNRKPIVFDPVGVGASRFRMGAVQDFLNAFQCSVIKGNAGELSALSGSFEVESKGVDSVGLGFKDPVAFIRNLARKERCTILLTGPVDYVSDGETVVSLHNGHEIMGRITGSGCIVGSAVATYCAAASSIPGNDEREDGMMGRGSMLVATIAGVLLLTIAGELAAEGDEVRGPGSFLPALIDEVWRIEGDIIRKRARIEVSLS